MEKNQEERRQPSEGSKRFVGGIPNDYSTGRTVFWLGKATTAAIFGAGSGLWIIIIIVGIALLTFLIVMVMAPVPFSPTPTATTPAPTTNPSTQAP